MLAAGKPPKVDFVAPAAHGLFHSLLLFWWLWLALARLAAGRAAWWLYSQRNLARSGIDEIDPMTGRIERRRAGLYQRRGVRIAGPALSLSSRFGVQVVDC